MKTITLKTNLQRYIVFILFISLGFSKLYSQDNSCITLDDCPTDITVCADTNFDGSSGPPFDGAMVNWNGPNVSQTCSGGIGNGNFNMLFELNEQLLTEDCWDFNYISRVGTNGGYVKLFSGNDGDGDKKSKIQTPFLILEDDTNVSIDVTYDNGTYDVQLFLIGGLDNFGNPYQDVELSAQPVSAGQPTYSWNADFDPGTGSITGITGVYRLLFVFTYSGNKPNNANSGDTVIAVEGFLSDDGCSAGVDFTVSGPNQGYYPIGVNDVEYVATYTSPSGEVITKSCSFTITVVGLEVTATGTDVSCSGATDGQITVQGSGAIADTSGYVLKDSSAQVIGILSNPANNPNPQYTFTPENTGNPIGAGTYTIEFDQVINGGICQAVTTVIIGTDPDTTPPAFSSCPTDISVNNDADECGAVVSWTQPIAGDNCTIASLTSNFNPGDTFPVGTTTVTYTATDGAGLTAECSFDVVVTDNEAPTIACPSDINLNVDAGNCSAVATFATPSGADNCSVASVTQTAGPASGSAFPVGTTIVTFEVTDSAGLTAECSFNVVVTDNEAPTIACPSDINLNVDAGNCSAVATFATPSGADNCSVASVTQTAGPASGSAFPVGTTIVTFEVTDSAGLTAECSFNVVVTDNEAPTIACPSDINLNVDAGNCSAVATFATPSGADNCSVASVTQTAGPASGSAFPVGTTIVTFEVTDSAGLTAECSFNVVVTDNEAPTIACPSDINLNVDAGNCSAVATFATPSGVDNCSIASVTQTAGPASGSAFPVGTTIVTFEVTDTAGLTAECSFNVVVTDNEAPTITCPSDINLNVDTGNCSAVATFATPSGADNCGVASVTQTAGPASGSAFPVGTTLVTFEVTDTAGLTAECSFNVVVTDNEAPTITCPSDINLNVDTGNCSAVATFATPSGADNCGVASVTQTAGPASGSAFPVGTTIVTFQVTDSAGLTAECSFNVVVTDNEAPTIACPSDINLNVDTGNCSAVATFATPSGADNCGVASVTQTAGPASGSAFPVGTTLVTFQVTDSAGLTAECSFNVVVTDNEVPTISCPDDITANTSDDGLGNCSTTVSLGNPITNDNCAVKSVVAQIGGIEIDPTTFVFDLGETIVTWIVTDNSDNTASCDQKVTVIDDEYPLFNAPPAITINCEDDPTDLSLTGTITRYNIDNCDVTPLDPEYSDITAPGSCPNESIITRTWVLYDLAGNFHSHTQTITVQDITPPSIIGTISPSNIAGCDISAAPVAETTAAGLEALGLDISDACSDDANLTITSSDSANGTCPIIITRTYTITDECGNSSQADQIITVDPLDINYSLPSDDASNSCEFDNPDTSVAQASVDADIAAWVQAQTDAINNSITGGCAPTVSNDFAAQSIDFCTGGSVTITWTIDDICQSLTQTATYTLNQPEAVAYTNPSDDSSIGTEFDDPDASVAQAALDADIAAWVQAQTDAINNSITGGCSPTVSNDFVDQSIAFCGSNSITITWTVEDICGTTNPTATYTFTQPDGINFTDPVDDSADACEFDNPDTSVAQASVDADIAAWVQAQTDAINNSITGGGSPTVSNDFVAQSIAFCTGGAVTITWTIDDICQTLTRTATYTLTQPEAVAYTNPSDDSADACEFDNTDPIAAQAALDADIAAWVQAQTDAINNSITGGCSPTVSNDFVAQSIDFCTGGAVTITWNVEDICGTTNPTATYTLTQPEAVAYTNPSDDSADACEFDNTDPIAAQAALDADIAAWVQAQTDAINNSITGGCSPTVSNDFVAQSIDFCTGGAVTITWNVEDICGTTNPTATYTLTQPEAIAYTNPSDDSADACEFDNTNPIAAQAALDADIAAWVQAQTDAINNSITGGCSPTVSNDFVAQSIDFCTGGAVTITWNVEDICGTTNPTATYTLTQPEAVAYTNPSDDSADACEFDNTDPIAAQAALDADIAAWVQAQTDAINNSITGGCSPTVSNDFVAQSIDFCTGGAVTITWNVEDICGTTNPTATYTLTQPEAVAYTNPSDDSADACEFDNTDPIAAQAALDADIAAWVQAQTDAINNSITGGCSPTVSNDFVAQSIDFCTGGAVTITWNVEDICGTTNPTATYTLTQPEAIAYTNPSDDSADACEFDNTDPIAAQAALDADIAAWVQAQTDAINNSITGGCSPTVSNDFVAQSIDFCTGGAVTITWNVEDICGTTNPTATYTLTQPEAVAYTNPSDDSADACEFDNTDPIAAQAALDADIAAWVQAQTDAINNSITGGCSPTVSNDFVAQSIDFCTGGAVTITWNVEDICGTTNPTATYTLTQPEAVAYTNPSDDSADACEFDNTDPIAAQAALDADIAAWVQAQTDAINNSITGGCSPTVSNDFVAQSIDFCTGGAVTITWNVEDICGTTNPTATYTLTQPEAIAYTNPSDDSADACEFDNTDPIAAQAALDADIAAWVQAQTDAINNSITGGCSPTVSNDFVAQSIDFCTGGAVTITWNVEDICGTTNPTATYTLTQPEAVAYTNPSDDSADACEFDNTDPIAAQAALDADIAAWVQAQTDAINNSITGGCSPTVSNDFVAQSIDFCTGGAVTITWNVEDICGTTNPTATYTLTQPEAVAYTNPVDVDESACNYADQDAINTAFTNWVETQSAAISVSGGCSPELTNNSNSVIVPELCTGGTATVTWIITDACETIEFSANFNLTAPTPTVFDQDTLPADITSVECDSVPDAAVLTASNSCGNVDVTFNEVRVDGDCISNYTLTRSWTATDVCNNSVVHTQTITVQDTTAPEPTTPFDETLNVSCTNIPEIPSLEFADNCSENITVEFDETNSYDENALTDYEIIRTWTVSDACGNENVYTQTLQVSLDEFVTEVNGGDKCYDDGVINLNDYLQTSNLTGVWEMIEGDTDAILEGNIFDPTVLELSVDFRPGSGGIDYLFKYTTSDQGCISITYVSMNINAECTVLPCGSEDVLISKAITPNGDQYNEYFEISGIELCGFITDVKIFNRWGALVYESNNYQNDWNATTRNSGIGNSGTLPNGTYYYIVILNNSGLNPFTGPVYIGTK